MDECMGSKAYDYLPHTPPQKRKSWAAQSPAILHDRLFPSRAATNFSDGLNLLEVKENTSPANNRSPSISTGSLEKGAGDVYEQLLQSELLGKVSPTKADCDMWAATSPEPQRLFQYKSMLEESPPCLSEGTACRSPVPLRTSEQSRHLNTTPRKIETSPFKVLDAPQMVDDFYLSLIDWSCKEDLAVALGSTVNIWNAVSCRARQVCNLGCDMVASVSWTNQGGHLGVGTSSGEVQIWDTETSRKVRTLTGHTGDVNALSWNGYVLSTGSQDGLIIHRDVRQKEHYFRRIQAHSQRVCGLKWSPDGQQLASGSNGNMVRIWNLRSSLPVLESSTHSAAVKALAWSPHQAGLLATGGGTADKRIQLWNTTNDVVVKSVNTGSQVCNLVWSENVNEIVSTHGYPTCDLAVWKCPSMTRTATLKGHARRVLFLTVSPDGRKVATGAGDETLRIWDIFPAAKAAPRSPLAALLPSTIR